MEQVKKVLLLGGTGFVGQLMANKLTKVGYDVIVPTRKMAYSKNLWVLPKVQCVEANIHDEQVLDQLMSRLSADDVVINLIGILHDSSGKPYGKKFAQNHVQLPKSIIKTMKQHGVKRLLHMSALGADSNGPSMYLRSKGDGEKLVKTSNLDWTIFRPSVIFGANDNFINLFGKLQRYLPIMPLGGAYAKFQPVSVHDVVAAFVQSIGLPKTVRHSYDLAGPTVYTLYELVKIAGKKVGRSSLVIPIPAVLGYLQAAFLEIAPGPTLMSRDNMASMLVDNVLPENQVNPLVEVFQIQPERLESLLS